MNSIDCLLCHCPCYYISRTIYVVRVSDYRIAGYFHGVLIFIIFVINKILHPRKFDTVGKGRQTKSHRVCTCAHNCDRTHGSIHQASLSCRQCHQLSNAGLNWKSICFCRIGDSHSQVFARWQMGHGECSLQKPRKLILEAKSCFSRIFAPLKIIRHTICQATSNPRDKLFLRTEIPSLVNQTAPTSVLDVFASPAHTSSNAVGAVWFTRL